MMRYYVIAGEASGDLHASNLVKELKKTDSQSSFRGWGGDLMKEQGVDIIKHYRDLAFMGFTEVIANLGTIMSNIRFCKKDIKSYNPDALILVDYPGFNLRIAKWAKKQGFNTIYYISPQVWAWKENRVHGIIKYVDKMYVILPFEKQFFQKWKYDVEYIGHPLAEVIDTARNEVNQLPLAVDSPINQKNIIALLPGSRKQEIEKKLPLMLEASLSFPDYNFVVAKASSLDDEFYGRFLEGFPKVRSIRNKTYDLLFQSKAALVTSGTATLETALIGVPQVVCYKGNPVSYAIAKRLIKIKYISLVNLIMDKPVVKELIQDELSVPNIVAELKKLTTDNKVLSQMNEDYDQLRKLLAEGGNASQKAARSISNFLRTMNFGKQTTSEAV
jgi:lipid-A-disaccharide synthase